MLSISEPIIKKLEHTFLSPFSHWNYAPLLSLCHMLTTVFPVQVFSDTLILEVFWNIKGESSYLVIAVLKQLTFTATLPGGFPRFFQKVYLSLRIMKKPQRLYKRNPICKYERWIHHAFNRQKRAKENEDKTMDDTKEDNIGSITKN